ncbi:DUF1570 domain-containing protein [Luteolibacter arcticus]|uniref:DUF1570 domain-containing protein n=1 Tax=Luteolibacter arcticus TaxID=1581411 RepID=A0ABT3GJH2_9BACT|nr:DUF1570 domain-containing protein [Luteolibacter arcticus]
MSPSASTPSVHKSWIASVLLLALAPAGFGQQESTNAAARVWTNTGGKKITAEYLGIRGADVALRLPGGKISFVPLAGLSTADNVFVKANRLDYHEKWQTWPANASQAMPGLMVAEETGAAGTFIYTTNNFRFHCDVNLGATLMKDLARTFELTLQLHAKSPFGVLAKPEKDRFEAKLFGTLADYRKAGGPGNTAGVYIPKQKVFLAPLELMGIQSGSAGYRKISDEYDVSTIVHELTHMLTHEMLDNLPLWVNEGYAEYIASIPIQAGVFKTDNERIREGVRDVFVMNHLRASTPSGKELPSWSKAERTDYLQGGKIPPLCKVAEVLQTTDEKWKASGPGKQGTAFGGQVHSRLPQLYRTSHLIIYYFIQIEGEKGVAKIRKFPEENRRNMDRYEQYIQDYEDYQKAMVAFMELPGVTKLPDGRFRYPSNLTPPKVPEGNPPDVNALKFGGLSALLDGESAEVVGSRIESALHRDLGIFLRFQ